MCSQKLKYPVAKQAFKLGTAAFGIYSLGFVSAVIFGFQTTEVSEKTRRKLNATMATGVAAQSHRKLIEEVRHARGRLDEGKEERGCALVVVALDLRLRSCVCVCVTRRRGSRCT